MAIIPGLSGSVTRAVDGIEGPTAGAPVVFPSGFQGSQIPTTLADANFTMTVASNTTMVMTPTATRTITLPTTGVPANYSVTVINRSASFNILVNSSGGNLVATVGLGQVTVLSTIASPTTAGHWSISTNGAVLQGGNSFGADIVLGTNDNFGVNIETNGTTKLAVSAAGAATIGPAAGLGTSGNAYHLLYGSLVSRNTTAGFFAHPSQVSLAANNYRDGSGTLKAIDTMTGLGLIELRAVSSGSSNFFSLYSSISAQTANTATTGLVEVMSLSALGAITSNHNSVDGTHRFFGSTNTSITRIYLGGNNDSSTIHIVAVGGATDAARALIIGDNNTDCISMRGDGSVRFPGTSTTASAANAFLDSADLNRIYRSTSSIKYKQDVRYSVDSSAVYNLKPCLYKSKVATDDATKDHLGFIAEDVHEIEPKLVHYMNEDPDGVQYERVTVLLVKAIQELKAELDQAKQEIEILKGN